MKMLNKDLTVTRLWQNFVKEFLSLEKDLPDVSLLVREMLSKMMSAISVCLNASFAYLRCKGMLHRLHCLNFLVIAVCKY